MRTHDNAPAGVAARGVKNGRATTSIARPLTDEARLAEEFLATLPDDRVPWIQKFSLWCVEKGLSESEAKAVRITCLRLRMFSAVERHARRARR